MPQVVVQLARIIVLADEQHAPSRINFFKQQDLLFADARNHSAHRFGVTAFQKILHRPGVVGSQIDCLALEIAVSACPLVLFPELGPIADLAHRVARLGVLASLVIPAQIVFGTGELFLPIRGIQRHQHPFPVLVSQTEFAALTKETEIRSEDSVLLQRLDYDCLSLVPVLLGLGDIALVGFGVLVRMAYTVVTSPTCFHSLNYGLLFMRKQAYSRT